MGLFDETEAQRGKDEASAGDIVEGANPAPRQLDPALEKVVVRKTDSHLIPLVMFLCAYARVTTPIVTQTAQCSLMNRVDLFAYLDRSNVGNAKIAGMYEALDLDTESYTWLLTIFYISYIVFEPLGLMWKIIPPHRWAAFAVMGWALCGTLQAATYSWSGMMAARFFLGAFEAAFSPGRSIYFPLSPNHPCIHAHSEGRRPVPPLLLLHAQ